MDATTILDQGELAIAQGNFEAAIAYYQDCIPSDEGCIWPLGVAYVLNGDEETAQAVWMEAIASLDPDTVGKTLAALFSCLVTEAERQLQQRRFEPAERAFRQALELEPESTQALMGLGSALAQQGLYESACEAWSTVTALEPSFIPAYVALGQTYQALREWPAAIAAYQALLTHKPDHSDIHHRLGQCLLRIGEAERAIAHLEQAIQHSPNPSTLSGDLGWAWLRWGNPATAMQYWQHISPQLARFITDYLAWETQLQEGDRSTAHLRLNRAFLQALVTGNTADATVALNQLLQRMGWNAGITPALELVSNSITTLPLQTLAKPESSLQQPDSITSTSGEVNAPTGFYETTAEWAQTHPEASYQPLQPPSLMPLCPPHAEEAEIHPSFRFGSQVPLPGAFVVIVPEGRYWIEENHQVAAIAADNHILGDVSPFSPILSPGHPDAHPSRHPLLRRATLPAPQKIDGRVAILSGLSNSVYFHWMLDLLPRFELLRQAGITPEQVDYYLVDTKHPFQKETLEQLGIPLEKAISPELVPHLEARSLILPSFPASISWMPEWACDFLRQAFLGDATNQPGSGRRLYISRAQASVRRLINEPQVLSALKPWGFETIHLENFSVQEQACLFAQAEVIVTLHGSGLTNLVFCQPATTVIELFSPEYVYPCYWLVANWRHLKYHYLLGQVPEGLFLHQMLYPDSRQEDVWVEPEHLLETLQKLGIKPV
ncbi:MULTISPECIES: glycosyltransferase 61 family protein [unclassified Leptolyngbya]|uniref:glycosyltransferase 61 family protein n=1 Tax=unclassified Leptolyngbya TaxID=2650499 RepID=UPI00168267E7|nr:MULTISPECIES: glycosyltransferase 61 family protein [unclassified Leptolyngbya]MBD1910776.1 DUF563 domain-containing protein [Leptolyngbya sp. FACHB-8]MBD2158852.1 DUF563 domain-containing protein [Leptolyngbya sp. FACHB-16]